jgi:G3E family GTPase
VDDPVAMTVPVIILTGFLGSGKTTLLNRMIAARAITGGTGKLALVVNELGEVGIDGALLPSDLTRQVELPGGCICCTLNEDLDRTLVELLDAAPDIATIVIETTGVAEPLPIAWAMEREPLVSRVRLAAVVTLVDVTGFVGQRALSPAVDAQVAYADVVVLTKTDLRAEAEDVRAAVRAIAPRAVQIAGTPDEIVGWLKEAIEDPPDRIDRIDQDHGHDHGHDHGIDAVWVPVDGFVDVEELEDGLAELPASYVRIKGLVQDGRGWVAVHRVGLRVSSERLDRTPAGLTGRIVALGPGVARAPLERAVVTSLVGTKP